MKYSSGPRVALSQSSVDPPGAQLSRSVFELAGGEYMQHVTTWGERDATVRFQGFVSPGDLLRCAYELTAEPRFESMSFFVADFLDIGGHAIDLPSVREDLAAQAIGALQTNSRYRVVVVTDDEGIEACIEKMRAIFARGGPEISLFRTRVDATRWMHAQASAPNFRDTRW